MKKWNFIKHNDNLVDSLSKEMGLPKFLSCLFADLKKYDDSIINRFFDVDKLKKRIDKTEKNFEKVCIFGDYDVDGITSTIMFYSYLCEKNIDVMYKLPSRYDEGYGLTNNVIDELKKYGVNLIITVDNGISAVNEIAYAKKVGIDVIVTDHHKVPDVLPDTDIIINPHIDGFYEYQDFAGVGVVFKIIQALEKDNIDTESLIKKYGDLFCLGTIGDVVPITGENKLLVKKSINQIKNSKRPGMIALLEGKVFGPELDGTEIAFGIIPVLNACGRMDSPEVAINLLLSETMDEARYFLSIASKMNEERKNSCNEIFNDVKEKILDKQLYNNHIIFASSEKWSHGLIGVVSSVISSKFGKPCFLFSIMDDEVRGSARSIEGFDICDCITHCSNLLEKYGGHPMAAGVTLKKENLHKFQEKILSFCNSYDMPFASIDINSVISLQDVSTSTLDEIQKLSPFGSCNREPIFAILSVKLTRVSSIGSGRHIKIYFEKDGKSGNAVFFGICYYEFLFKVGDLIDLAVRIKANYFSGKKDAVLHVVDVRYSNFDSNKFIEDKRRFEDFISDIKSFPEEEIPNKEDFSVVFKFIKDNHEYRFFRIDKLCMSLSNISPLKIYTILEIFSELKVMDIKKYGENYELSMNPIKKVNLNDSYIFSKMKGNMSKKTEV